MSKTDVKAFEAYFAEPLEAKFDVRLLEKKIEHGVLTRQDRDAHIKGLEAVTEYEFTSAEALDAQTE